jgi:hypothetical protein
MEEKEFVPMTEKPSCYNDDENCNREAVVTCNVCDGEFCKECYKKTHEPRCIFN